MRSYNDAMATIRRVPSVEHNFQLVITQVYEGEELLEDEDESVSPAYRCPSFNPTDRSNQPTRSAFFLSERSWNLGPVRPKANPLSCGAIWKAEWTSSTSLWQLGRTNQPRRSSRRACTGRCTKENTRNRPIISPTLISKSSYTSQSLPPFAPMGSH